MKRAFGRTGRQVSILGQGTWMIEKDPERQAVEALRLGIELGMTLIDTAEMYGNGRAEEIVAEAISGRRDQVFVVSKVLPDHASYDGTRRACERSLKRLRTAQLDLYLLHWESKHPIEETMRALESLVADKAVRYIGVSNFDVEALRAAQNALRHEPLSCNQVLYHLKDRGIERRLLPYCEQQQIAVMGYSPFGHDGFPSPGSRGGKVLQQIARAHGSTPRQTALNFLLRSGVFMIPKSGKPDHVRENRGALDWALTSEEFAAIDRAFPVREKALGMI